ncbi:hypothetical protein LGT39_02365 [Demequina sp. TTPB684]|uniref:hypothetical protein n=1 Tax=unclassified Demequina TaxID=2620311 RepID=UPI001CF39574|nr:MULTISPECIES: hypothetical protein [unclassified Demequina]MCB2411691.1 hypothetical protein [Demequina sp. TTPB684]UPU88912.1 hypothetical protein LGT36_003050 [Demequina sp. TMPB413]
MSRVKHGAIAVSIALLLAACSSPGSPDFWGATSIDGLEANQPTSVAELVDRSEVVVRGVVTDIEEGPIDNPAYAGDDFPIVALEITIAEVVEGSFPGDTIKVIMPREPTVSVASMKSTMPSEEVLVFVVHSGVEDYYATFSDLSVVTTINDNVQAVLDPVATEVVTRGTGTWEDVVDLVKDAARN